MVLKRYTLGSYIFHTDHVNDCYSISKAVISRPDDPNNKVKRYDRQLHQKLEETFEDFERREETTDLFLGSEKNTKQNLKIKRQILEQEPILSRHFSAKELEKLSLLWITILAGYKESAELLVRSGADVNEPFGSRDPQVIDRKWTVLHVLIQMDLSFEPLITLITKRGANLKVRDSRGQNVLHFALMKDRAQMAELLLESKDIDLQARDFCGQTVLHVAVAKARVQMTEMLLKKGAEVNVADNNGLTPLLKAASSSKLDELLPLLMRHKANVFAKSHGNNMLHLLTLAPDVRHAVDLARILIRKGVSLNDREHAAQYQPIHKASMAGHNELVTLYLNNGAKVDSLTSDEVTPLHLAARNRGTPALSVLETILDRGAELDRRSNEGRTALHVACEYANCEGIRVLVATGANMFAKDRVGNTPFALLMNRQCMDEPSIRLMLNLLAVKKVCLPKATELEDERIIKERKMWEYFQDCMEQVERMKRASFHESCTFLQLLTKSRKQLAGFMRNRDFESKFKLYYDERKSEFPTYAEELVHAFERAQRYYTKLMDCESTVVKVTKGVMPSLIVTKIAQYLSWIT